MTPASPNELSKSRVLLQMWVVIGLFVAAIVFTAWITIERARLRAIAQAHEQVSRTANAATANLNRLLLGVDLTLVGLIDSLKPAFDKQGRLDIPTANLMLGAINDARLEVTDVAILEPDGRSLATGLPATQRNGMTMPKGFVDQVLVPMVPTLMVSAPILNPLSAETTMYMARKVQRPDGRPALAVAEVPSSLFTNTLDDAREAVTYTVSFESADGMLLASVPANNPLVGRKMARPLVRPDPTARTTEALGRLNAVPSLVAVRASVYPQILLSVSYPLSEALRTWRDDRNAVLGVAATFLLLALTGGGLGHWQFVRLADARSAGYRSAQALDQALASIADGFLLCDADDRVARWNAQYVDFFPWLKPVLATGVPYRVLAETAALYVVPNGNEADRQQWVEQRMALHRSDHLVWEQDLGNGRVVNASERGTPEGGVVAIYRDITQEERRLEQARAAAEAANQAKSQFLANMSHEIRTPLNAVLGLNTLMLRTPLTSEQLHHVKLIQSSGELLLAIINDVLDISKIEAQRMDLLAQPFSPGLLAQEVTELMAERAHEKSLTLKVQQAPDLAPLLVSDPARLRQVMFNLVGNALKFTESGQVQVNVSSQPMDDGRVQLCFTVEDTGIGIEAQALPTLFQRFTQGDTRTDRRYGGSGLGLAITRGIVDLMGGEITVASLPGQGSTFTVRVPCQPGHRNTTTPPPVPVPAARGLAILVAEDNPVNQVVITAALQQMGHRPHIVENGLQAVEQARSGGYDLILMDMQMPEMDGVVAARTIRASGQACANIPIIAMTANAQLEDRAQCLDAGMNDYLSKPINFQALADTIERFSASTTAP